MSFHKELIDHHHQDWYWCSRYDPFGLWLVSRLRQSALPCCLALRWPNSAEYHKDFCHLELDVSTTSPYHAHAARHHRVGSLSGGFRSGRGHQRASEQLQYLGYALAPEGLSGSQQKPSACAYASPRLPEDRLQRVSYFRASMNPVGSPAECPVEESLLLAADQGQPMLVQLTLSWRGVHL